MPYAAFKDLGYKVNKMFRLNLPDYEIKIKEKDGKPHIFDFLRRKFVALTPEEWVRQHFVHFLAGHKGYPAGLIANEVELRIGSKRLRCDSIIYNKEAQPVMIVEYKAPTIPLTQHVFNQITAYNILLHVDYLTVSNGMQHICCKMNHEQHSYRFLTEIPAYAEL